MSGERGESPRERIAYWGYAGAQTLAQRLSESTGRRVFRWLAHLAHATLPGVRATVAANQARVLGQPVDAASVQAATREAFELYGRYWFETFRLPMMTAAQVGKRFDMKGLENIDAAMEAGTGIIAALPHMGNWDAPGTWLDRHGYRVAAVAEELKPARLLELFVRHRETIGIHVIPLSANANVGQQVARLLGENWIVALVADRDLGGRGVEVEMFGATRRLPAGPALLSLSTGAPLVVAPVFTTEDGWACRIGPPLHIDRTGELRADIVTLTRRMAAEFERAIAAHPTDWHMFQPAWPA